MSKKEIQFSLKLNIDGKEQFVNVTSSVRQMQKALSNARTASEGVMVTFMRFNQATQAFATLRDALQGLCADSNAYSAAMAKANTMAGKQGEDFAQLKGQVADLAKEIPMARDALADGLYQVISNGVPENNWIEFLRASAKASVGGIADLGETVKVTSTLIKNYGLSWDQATAIQDKIQLTAKNGVTSFEQLAMALPRVTGNAATLGVSIDDLMATFSTLTGVTGNTAEVSTQLAAIFTALVKPSSEATKMAQQMGIEFNAAAIKSAGGFRQFLTTLDSEVQAYASKTGMLSQEIYAKLFGSAESLRALGPLTNQLKDKFAQNAEAMADSAGTIDSAFDTMSGTGGAQLQLIKNKFAEVTDFVATGAKRISPVLNFAASLGLSINAFNAVKSSVVSFAEACGVSASKLALLRTAALNARLGVIGLVAALGAITLNVISEEMQRNSKEARRLREESEKLKAIERGRADGQKMAAQVMAQANSATEAQTQKLSRLRNVVKDNNAKMADRLAAIRKLQGIIPGYTANIDAQGNAYERNTSKVDDYIKKLKELYVVEAMEKQLKELYKKEVEQTGRVNTARHEYVNSVTDYNKERREQKAGSGPGFWQSFVRNFALATAGGHGGRSGVALSEAANPTKSIKKDRMDTARDNFLTQKNALTRIQNYRTALYEAIEKVKAEQKNGGGNKSGGSGGNNNGNANNSGGGNSDKEDKPAAVGSLDWYDEAIQWCDKYIKATNDVQAAEEMMVKKSALEANRKDLAIKIGVEKPDKVEVKSALEQLQDQLKEAQTEFDNATTIEAKVKAAAKVAELQQQIDTATNGQLSIKAEVEPQYIVKGSMADKRKSYQNAQTKASRIQSDFDAGLINKDEAEKQINDLNATINAELGKGVKPFELKVDTTSAKKSFSDFASNMQSTWGAIESGVNSIVNLSDNLDNAKTGWDKFCVAMNAAFSIMSTITAVMQFINLLTGAGAAAKGASAAATATDTAAKTADAAASTAIIAANKATTASYIEMASAAFFAAHAYIPFAGAGIASGFVTQAVATTKAAGLLAMAFANGGIVPGASYSGDRLMARVNSGEMILNRTQQMRLWRIVNTPVVATPQVTTQQGHNMPKLNLETLRQSLQPQVVDVNVRGRLSGRDLQLVMDKRNTITSRS